MVSDGVNNGIKRGNRKVGRKSGEDAGPSQRMPGPPRHRRISKCGLLRPIKNEPEYQRSVDGTAEADWVTKRRVRRPRCGAPEKIRCHFKNARKKHDFERKTPSDSQNLQLQGKTLEAFTILLGPSVRTDSSLHFWFRI